MVDFGNIPVGQTFQSLLNQAQSLSYGDGQRVPFQFSSTLREFASQLSGSRRSIRESTLQQFNLTSDAADEFVNRFGLAGAEPVISTMVNPQSIRWVQDKRGSRDDVRNGTVFYHFLDKNGQDNDVLVLELSGTTGNIDRREDVLAPPATDPVAARRKLAIFQNLYSLTREPRLIPPRTVNEFTIRYQTKAFPVAITFIGFFSQVLTFEENADNPNAVDWSMQFTVQRSSPSLNQVLAETLRATQNNTAPCRLMIRRSRPGRPARSHDRRACIFSDWRIFIFGVDVTEDVTRCIINHSGSKSRAPSTAEIELVNGGTRTDPDSAVLGVYSQYPTDRYIVTPEDIAVLYGAEAELSQIQFPTVKDVLKEIGPIEFNEEEDQDLLPTFEEALAILRPDLDPLNPTDQAVIDELRTREAAFRQEAYQRSERLSRAREETNNRVELLLKTEVAQRQDTLDRLVLERLEAAIDDPIKRRVLLSKFNVRQQLKDADGNDLQPNLLDPYDSTTIAGLPQLTGQALRYPFQSGDCIFHSNDMVRIFWRDPARDEEVWYHMFAGFVSDAFDMVDADDRRVVRLRFEDASRILRYARITTNPGILTINDVKVTTDAITRTFFNNEGFSGLTLPEFLFTVIFGASYGLTEGRTGTEDIPGTQTFTNLRYSVNGTSQGRLIEDAVGAYHVDRSFIATFGPDDPEAPEVKFPSARVSNLGEYQALVDHRVHFSDLENMALPDTASQQEKATLQRAIRRRGDGTFVPSDIVQAIGANPHVFPTDFGRVVMLIPGSLGPGGNRDLLLRDLSGVNTQTTWRSRLALIYDVMDRIDFQFFASPKGDLLCEMPLYDFEPDNFGNTAIQLAEFLDKASSRIKFDLGGERERGPYGPAYRVAKRDTISWERAQIDENVRTQMVGVANLIPGFSSLPTSDTVGQVYPVNLYGLMPQYGVRSELAPVIGIISNPNAARVFANVKLNQINADAKTADVAILPRVQAAFPNRPMEFEERVFVATTQSMSHSLVWGSSMSLSMSLNFVRAWGGQTTSDDPPRPVYEPIGGFASQGLNYALRFGLSDPAVKNARELGE